jgi:hypothetical protein
MKKFLMVLCVLALSVPATADVLVYNAKQLEVEIQNTASVWLQLNGNYSDYFVIEPNDANGTAVVWSVMTYKAKDLNGKTQNYYTTQNLGTLNLLKVQINSKETWIISGISGQLQIVLIGAGKPAKPARGDHGDGPFCSACHSKPDQVATPACAPTMTGASVWDETAGGGRVIGTAKIVTTLNIKMTSQVAKSGYNASDAVGYIVDTLTAKGYLEEK